MTTQDALAAGTPDYSNVYAPIDAARYQNQEAQLYFEEMRARQYQQARKVGNFNKRQGKAVLTGDHSFKQMRTHAGDAPMSQDYGTYSRMGNAYTQDMADRIFDSAEIWGGVATFAGDFGLSIAAENSIGKWGAARGMGGVSRFALGSVGGMAVGMGVTAAAVGASKFVGLGQAFKQFEEIDQLREASPMMMAGNAGDVHTGRMSREDAQTIASYLHKSERYSMLQREGQDINELQNEIGTLAEHQLLEGVRNTDEFVRKFRRLKESLQKMTEMFGKTFEEGAVMLQEFRNMGADPMTAFHAIKKGYDVAVQHGIDPEQAHAAGMRGALAVQGTGLSMESGYMSGVSAEGSARTIFDQGLVSGRTMFNLGGPQNLGMAIQRSQMRYLQSQAHTASMMSAIGRDGVDFGMIADTASGERSLSDNIQGVSRNISGVEDLMRYRAAQSEITSRIQERHPGAVSAMAVNQVATMVRDQLGIDPSTLSKSELAQYAPSLIPGMSSDEFKILMADVEANALTMGREKMRERDIDEARFRDQVRLGVGDRAKRSFTTNALTVGIVHRGAEMEEDVRRNVFEMNRGLNDWFAEVAYGQSNIHISGEAASSAQRIRELKGNPTIGSRYDDAWYRSGEASDILQIMMDEGEIDTSNIVKPAGSARLRGDVGSDIFTEADLGRLGIDANEEGVNRMAGVGEAKFTVGRDTLSQKGWTFVEGRGYIRQEELNKTFDRNQKFADTLTEANAEFDYSSLSGDNLDLAIEAQGLFLGRMEKGSLGRKLAGDIEGEGRFKLRREIEKTAAESLGIDTSKEGWREAWAQKQDTPEGKIALGAIMDMGRQIDGMGDAMDDVERYIKIDPNGTFTKDRADAIMGDIEGMYERLDNWGPLNPLSDSANPGVQKAFENILDKVDGAQDFTIMASHYLLAETEEEKEALIKKADEQFGANAGIALTALEEEDTPFMKKLRDSIMNEGADAAMILGTSVEGAEGTRGAQTISGRGTRLEQGQAYREEQEMINLSLKETYDMLSALSNSVESLHNKINGSGGGGDQTYGIVGGVQSLFRSVF